MIVTRAQINWLKQKGPFKPPLFLFLKSQNLRSYFTVGEVAAGLVEEVWARLNCLIISVVMSTVAALKTT